MCFQVRKQKRTKKQKRQKEKRSPKGNRANESIDMAVYSDRRGSHDAATAGRNPAIGKTLNLSYLTLMLLVANLANTKWCKNLKNDWNSCTWVLSVSFAMNTDMTRLKRFSKKTLHPCALDESSISIGRVKSTSLPQLRFGLRKNLRYVPDSFMRSVSFELVIWMFGTQHLSQDSETGCPKLGILFFKGDHKNVIHLH